MGVKILFIDDRKEEFDKLEQIFFKDSSQCFELVNKVPMFDESSSKFMDREQQKNQIINLMRNEQYEVVLFDLSLRSDREENFKAGEACNLLSIEIYNEMKQWLLDNHKKFIFVTGHDSWKNEQQFRTIGEMVKDADYLRKPSDVNENYVACAGYLEDGTTKCGDVFTNCNKGHCFSRILWRLANDE